MRVRGNARFATIVCGPKGARPKTGVAETKNPVSASLRNPRGYNSVDDHHASAAAGRYTGGYKTRRERYRLLAYGW